MTQQIASSPAGPSSRAPARAVWGFTALFVAGLAILPLLHALATRDVFGPVADESLLVPIALRHVDPALFPGDVWLSTTAPIFSLAYSRLIGTLLGWIDDPVVALRLLSLPFHVVLVAGTWRIAERSAGRKAGWVAALLVLIPLAFAELVFAAGSALPRDLVFAALPWFLLAVLDTPSARRVAGPAVFLGLGVLANLHPLTALHFAALLLVVGLVLEPTPRGLVAAVLRGLAFVAGAAPYVLQYLGRPAAAGAVDPVVYAWRLSGMAGETLGAWGLRMEPLLWLAVAAFVAVGLRGLRTLPRWLLAALAVSMILASLGPTLGRIASFLSSVQLVRFERIAAWLLAIVAVQVLARPGNPLRALAALGIVAGVSVSGMVGAASPHGPVSIAARWVDRNRGVPYAAPRPPALVARIAPDPTSDLNRSAFLGLCESARTSTLPGDLFLVPPENWGSFRAHARRAVAVTRKEGGAALSFLGAGGMAWFEDYADAVRVYAEGDEAAWRALAERWHARYVVTDETTSAPPWHELPSTSGPFRILEVPSK